MGKACNYSLISVSNYLIDLFFCYNQRYFCGVAWSKTYIRGLFPLKGTHIKFRVLFKGVLTLVYFIIEHWVNDMEAKGKGQGDLNLTSSWTPNWDISRAILPIVYIIYSEILANKICYYLRRGILGNVGSSFLKRLFKKYQKHPKTKSYIWIQQNLD